MNFISPPCGEGSGRSEIYRLPFALPVYAAAYKRDVTDPAAAFLATIPVAIDGLNKSLRLADYLDAHRNTVKVNGASIQAADKKTSAEVSQLLNAMNAQEQKLNEARRALQAATAGP